MYIFGSFCLLKNGGVTISKIYYFKIMVYCLYTFNPCTGINENCNYLSRINV